jgi:hypothetical protein
MTKTKKQATRKQNADNRKEKLEYTLKKLQYFYNYPPCENLNSDNKFRAAIAEAINLIPKIN